MKLFDLISKAVDEHNMEAVARDLACDSEKRRLRAARKLSKSTNRKVAVFLLRQTAEYEPLAAGNDWGNKSSVLDALHATLVTIGTRNPELLASGLRSKREATRSKAVEMLGRLRNRQVLSHLLTATNDSSPMVRSEAVLAIARLALELGSPERLSDPRHEESWVLHVSRDESRIAEFVNEQPVREALCARLQDDADDVKNLAGGLVKRYYGLSAASELIRTPDVSARLSVAEDLGRAGDERSVKLLAKLLGDSADMVRETAIKSLPFSQPERYLGKLIVIMRQSDKDVQKAAHGLLESLDVEHSCKLVVPVLGHKRSEYRKGAAEALCVLGWEPSSATQQEAFLRALIEILDEECRWRREAKPSRKGVFRNWSAYANSKKIASEALSKFNDERALQAFLGQVKEGRNAGFLDFSIRFPEHRQRILEELAALLSNHGLHAARAAAEVLQQLTLKGVREQAIIALICLDAAAGVQQESQRMKVLRQLGPDACAALFEVFVEFKEYREFIIECVGKIGDEHAVSPLIGAWNTCQGRILELIGEALVAVVRRSAQSIPSKQLSQLSALKDRAYRGYDDYTCNVGTGQVRKLAEQEIARRTDD